METKYNFTPEFMEKLTPAMRQYAETKLQYPDCILFFRLGDFYEMFFDDALNASKAMEVTLTSKSCGLSERAPMCGVPYHSVETYLARLIEKGFKVAICEQMEDPATAKGIVKREVIRVVTPGTIISGTMLDESSNNYLVSVFGGGGEYGLSYCDISTGELCALRFAAENDNNAALLMNELTKLDPPEILINESASESSLFEDIKNTVDPFITVRDDDEFGEDTAVSAVKNQFGVTSLSAIGLEDSDPSARALGAMLLYLAVTEKQSLSNLIKLDVRDTTGSMSLDRATLKNLELTETLFEKKVSGSLLGVLDKTVTAMGARKLKSVIRMPLNEVTSIRKRLDAVECLYDDILIRNDIKAALKGIYDLERLTGRVALGTANGRDMISLRNSLGFLPELKAITSGTGNDLLETLSGRIAPLEELYDMIGLAITDDPPFSVREGGLIKPGYNEELDDLKQSIRDGQEWIAGLETSERERTGIKTLKVGFNKVFGYYIDVTKANTDMVPDNYIRKQTLVNNERYITAELKEVESKVLNAETKINNLEYRLFTELREHIASFASELRGTAEAVAMIDVLLSFAEVSVTNNYVKPDVNDSDVISVMRGRHPVIEESLREGMFVSNDTYIDRSDSSLLLITGPNMAGKSTYMRQTALIVLMAQLGCFVPADSASIGIADRIFTRIGASDNLSQGQSTFYVEMNELAYILNSATSKSLIILDEIGRGTSTYDGLSIAWALAEHLCGAGPGGDAGGAGGARGTGSGVYGGGRKSQKIRTLFATHYHELTVLSEQLSGLKNLNVGVSEESGDVVFLHKIVEGSASRSYGIHVAKLAGVPGSLLERAGEKLAELESGARDEVGRGVGRGDIGGSRVSEESECYISEPGDDEAVSGSKDGAAGADESAGDEFVGAEARADSGKPDSDAGEGRNGRGGRKGKSSGTKKGRDDDGIQLDLFAFLPNSVTERLRSLDLMNITPSQAIAILEELKDAAEKNY